MAANLGRWWKYAQAKLNGVVSSSNAELDELEAEQAARAADKPWLSSESDAPTIENGTRLRAISQSMPGWRAEHSTQRAREGMASSSELNAATPSSLPNR